MYYYLYGILPCECGGLFGLYIWWWCWDDEGGGGGIGNDFLLPGGGGGGKKFLPPKSIGAVNTFFWALDPLLA